MIALRAHPQRLERRRRRHTPRDLCGFCNRLAWDSAAEIRSCIDFSVRGRNRVPHQWPDPQTPDEIDLFSDSNPCKCSAPVGGRHHYGCDIEVCPWADDHPDDGEQALCCGCFAKLDPL